MQVTNYFWFRKIDGNHIRSSIGARVTKGPVFFDGKYWYEVAHENKKYYGYAFRSFANIIDIQESPVKGYMIFHEDIE